MGYGENKQTMKFMKFINFNFLRKRGIDRSMTAYDLAESLLNKYQLTNFNRDMQDLIKNDFVTKNEHTMKYDLTEKGLEYMRNEAEK